MTGATMPRRRGPRIDLTVARDYVILVSFVALFVVLALSSSAFLTQTNLANILDQQAALGIIACGATLVIVGGGFDLSVGAIFALSAVLAGMIANSVDPTVGIIAGMVVGLLLGVFNGLLVTVLRINSFIATIASTLLFSGVTVLITEGGLVTVQNEAFRTLGSESLFSFKYTVYVLAVFVLLMAFVLARTRFGAYIYAVGGNADAARLSGIRVNLVRIGTFAISGLAAGLAGVLATSRVGTAAPDAGAGLELAAIAAVVIGGASIAGGEGTIWRTVLGVLLLALIGNGFNILAIDPSYQPIVQGLIIIGAVSVDAWSRRKA
jgi:ribose transport system permease protein